MLALLALLLAGGAAPDPETTRGLGKLSIAIGNVEAKPPGAPDFQALKVGADVEAGTTLRTGAGVKAIFDFADNAELRLNENTEILVDGARAMTLTQGRVYLRVLKAAAPFDLKTPLHPITTETCVVDLMFVPHVPNGAPAATTITVLEGKVKPYTKKFSPFIFAGWSGTGYGPQLNTPNPVGNGSMSTAWVHPLLVERGKVDEETASRTDELITILGAEAKNDPAEGALRTLGPLAVPGILRFVKNSDHITQADRRAVASRILSDVTPLKSAKDLAGLLTHVDPEVRVQSARGLARLNGGKDLGYNDAFWKGTGRDAGQKAWEEWIKKNAP